MRNTNFEDQAVAAIVQEGLNIQQQQQIERLVEIQQIAAEKMQYAQNALNDSLRCVEDIRDFVSKPDNILGSMQTKHGEIAEHIEVEIRNGRDILNRISPSATFNGVGRTAPEDYIIAGSQVQSKFTNGANKSLDHVLEHLNKYPKFTDNGYYHMPKDQYELILKMANSDNIDGVNSRTINKCRELISQIESETGKSFSEVVRPGISSYNDVQLGKVGETLDIHEQEFRETNAKEVSDINKSRQREQASAKHITDPSWGEAMKYSAVAAVISGTTSAGIKIYSKISDGKKISEFTLGDWKDVGYDFAKGGTRGGVSGMAIYGLTKLGGFSAPFAGAIVGSTIGIASLANDYRKGNLSANAFSSSACSLSVEAGLSAVGAAVGQAVIPIPVLGAIIGTAVAKASLETCRFVCGKDEEKLMLLMQSKYDEMVKSLDVEAAKIIAKMDSYYDRLGGYINAAMSKESAVSFYGSIELCRFLNIPEECIIHNLIELDDYMLS